MAQYSITLKITEGDKRAQKRGERETVRYRILKAISGGFPGVSLGDLRSVRIRKVRKAACASNPAMPPSRSATGSSRRRGSASRARSSCGVRVHTPPAR